MEFRRGIEPMIMVTFPHDFVRQLSKLHHLFHVEVFLFGVLNMLGALILVWMAFKNQRYIVFHIKDLIRFYLGDKFFEISSLNTTEWIH